VRHEWFLLKEGSSSGKVRLRMAMGDEAAGTEILSPFAAGETELGAGQMNKGLMHHNVILQMGS
jgi:hypothetical protein